VSSIRLPANVNFTLRDAGNRDDRTQDVILADMHRTEKGTFICNAKAGDSVFECGVMITELGGFNLSVVLRTSASVVPPETYACVAQALAWAYREVEIVP